MLVLNCPKLVGALATPQGALSHGPCCSRRSRLPSKSNSSTYPSPRPSSSSTLSPASSPELCFANVTKMCVPTVCTLKGAYPDGRVRSVKPPGTVTAAQLELKTSTVPDLKF